MRWLHARISLRWIPEMGEWKVTDRSDDGWVEILPLDDAGKSLAAMGSHGKLWVRPRDITRLPDQTERLL